MARLVFVCWGNICRSPMAERVAVKLAAERGLNIEIESFGVSSEETGNPIDYRAAEVLRASGYDPGNHRARRISADDIASADLVVAAEPMHIRRLRSLVDDDSNLAVLNDFNPSLPSGTSLDDPWYGNSADFRRTLADIEAAMSAILDEFE